MRAKTVTAAFDSCRLTSDSSVMLLVQPERAMAIRQRIAEEEFFCTNGVA